MDEDLKKLLEENLRISQENHQMLKSMKRHFLWQKVVSVFYFILIVGPIIVGVVFLPSLLKPIIGQYQELLGGASLVNDGTSAVKITPDLINQLKSLSK